MAIMKPYMTVRSRACDIRRSGRNTNGSRFRTESYLRAAGIEGLAPYSFQFDPTFYFRDGGYLAGRVSGSYDLLTQRLIAQPELEMNFYSKQDPEREIGTGLSDLDTGRRLRYEFSRKLAPYVGFAYDGKFGGTATFPNRAGESVADLRFVFGLRVWY
jgi:copper resistance protein B